MHTPLHQALLQLKPGRAPHLPQKPKETHSNPLKDDAAQPRLLSPCCPGSGCSHLLARSCDRVPAGEMRLIWRSPRRGWAILSRTTTCSRYSTCWSRCSAQALLRVLARSTWSARMYLPGTGHGIRMGTECMDALLYLNLVFCCFTAKIILSATAILSVLAWEFAELLDGNEMSLKCFKDLCLMGCKGAALL